MKVEQLIEYLKTIDNNLEVEIADSQHLTVPMSKENIRISDDKVTIY